MPQREAGGTVLFAPDDRAGGEPSSSRPRILIVEDEYLIAVQVEETLVDAGFEVVGTASTAAQAVRLANAEQPALVVMDVRLIGAGDGVEAALEIYGATGIRCIFTTAYTDPEMQRRAAAAAPFGWLGKPYRMEALVGLIRRALGSEPGAAG